MKKTLIAVALATLSTAAMADVILYGQIKGGVEVSKVKGESGTTTNIVDYGSRIGFKGHEHLNGDLKAIWQLEQSVNIGGGRRNVTTSTGETTTEPMGFGSRNSFIGLEGGFGKVTVGYQHGFVADNDATDVWAYSSNVAGLGTFTRSNDVLKRRTSVKYVSPDFGGFSFGAYVSPSDNNNTTRDSAAYGAGLYYKHGAGFFANALGGFVKNGENNTTAKKKDAFQAVAQFGYDAKPWYAAIAYQHARNVDGKIFESDSKITRAQEVAATVAYNINDTVRIKGTGAYGFRFRTADGEKAWGNGKYAQGVVGADVMLSKRTTLNGQVGYIQVGNGEDKFRTGALSVGMKHQF